jgi:hypothetical protein
MANPTVVKNATTTNTVISLNFFIFSPPLLCLEFLLKSAKTHPVFQNLVPVQTTEAIVGNAPVLENHSH